MDKIMAHLQQHDQAWLKRAEEVEAFKKEHGLLPNTKQGRAGVWMRDQRINVNISDERRTWLDTNLPGWTKTVSNQSWRTGALDLEAFFRREGRMPHQVKDGIHGSRLKTWRKDIGQVPERDSWLDEHIPGWRPTSKRAGQKRPGQERISWEKRASELEAFVAENGRYPFRKEGVLGVWIANQRLSPGPTAQRREWLDKNLPGWADTLVAKGLTELNQLRAITSIPEASSPEGKLIASIGVNFLKRGKAIQDELLRLGFTAPTVQRNLDEIWQSGAGRLHQYVKTEGHFPRDHRDAVSREEYACAQFLGRAKRDPDLAPERAAWLDANLPGWHQTAAERRWWVRAQATAKLFQETGKFPSRLEPALKTWLNTQRINAKISADRVEWLDENLSGWRGRQTTFGTTEPKN